jgi:hypothetical protein
VSLRPDQLIPVNKVADKKKYIIVLRAGGGEEKIQVSHVLR